MLAPRTPATASRSVWPNVIRASLGNLVEWYDWYVYSAFSLYFARAFFPPASQTAQLLNAAAVFAAGFLMRPLGGWLMGRYADRRGRRAALTASVLLMCFGSLMIAVTPGYARIGVAAPVLLVVARLLQGLSVVAVLRGPGLDELPVEVGVLVHAKKSGARGRISHAGRHSTGPPYGNKRFFGSGVIWISLCASNGAASSGVGGVFAAARCRQGASEIPRDRQGFCVQPGRDQFAAERREG